MEIEIEVERKGKKGMKMIIGGEWNEGMKIVGVKGKGERVWIGWLMEYKMKELIKIDEERKEKKREDIWKENVERMKEEIERDGWDGEWYRRGF